jgi:hypothetical protein
MVPKGVLNRDIKAIRQAGNRSPERGVKAYRNTRTTPDSHRTSALFPGQVRTGVPPRSSARSLR